MGKNVFQLFLFCLVSLSLPHPTESLESWERECGQHQLNGDAHPCLGKTGDFFR